MSISDATRTVAHSPHFLGGASLQVLLFEEFEDENPDDFDENTEGEDSGADENDIIIIVSGILPSTSQDAIVNYFENSRRSGGGEVSKVHYTDDGEAIISFFEVKGMCYSVAEMVFPGFPCSYNKYGLCCCRELPFYCYAVNDISNQKLMLFAIDFKQRYLSVSCLSRKRSGFTFTSKMLAIPKGLQILRECTLSV